MDEATIKGIRLINFLAHRDTALELTRGINVILGPNGAGKSSIVDAITYALFGVHSRGDNANLPRRGARRGEVEVVMEARGQELVAVRRFGEKGQLISTALYSIEDGERRILAKGESRRSGSVSSSIASILGIDHKDLLTAAIVRQGELSSVIDSTPREFRDMLSRLTGLEKLQKAYEGSRELLRLFSEQVKGKTGYRPEDYHDVKGRIEELKGRIEELKGRIVEERRKLEGIVEERRKLEGIVEELRGKKEVVQKIEDLKERLRKARERRMREVEGRMREVEREIRAITEARDEMERLRGSREEMEELERELERERELVEGRGRLEGLLSCSDRLAGERIRCPVCGSEISLKDVELLDKGQLRERLEELEGELEDKGKGIRDLKMVLGKRRREVERFEGARRVLEGLGGIGKLDELRRELDELRRELETGEIVEEESRALAAEIGQLERSVSGFRLEDYRDAVDELERVREEEIGRREMLGELRGRVDEMEGEEKGLEAVIGYLEGAHRVKAEVDEYREKIYARDSQVAIALRRWLLEELSVRASDMLEAFQLRIQRVELSEDRDGVRITCFHDAGDVDVRALSGGERMALALSLRLAIASLVAGNVDFIVLDEPTAHLDRERRRGFVRMMLEAFRRGLGHVSQLVVITHDNEVFEGVDVDSVYSFRQASSGIYVERLLQ